MRNLYMRAASYQSLTPFERALLRLVEGLICAGLVAALPIIADALGNTGVNWADVARAALAAAVVAVLLALAKYAKAHADPVLADALDELGAALSTKTNSNAAGNDNENAARATDASDSEAAAVSVPVHVEAGARQ